MSLKNKLTEDEYYELEKIKEEYCHLNNEKCFPNRWKLVTPCKVCRLNALKQSDIIRKSAREETDEYIDNLYCVSHFQRTGRTDQDTTKLKQLLAAEREERK